MIIYFVYREAHKKLKITFHDDLGIKKDAQHFIIQYCFENNFEHLFIIFVLVFQLKSQSICTFYLAV